MPNGTEPMHKPSWFLTNITLGNVILLVTVVFGAGLAWAQVGGLSSEIAGMKRDQAEWRNDRDKQDEVRRVTTEAVLSSLSQKVQPLEGLMYRLGKAEGNIDFINGRIDRVVDAMQRAIDPLTKEISQLTTKVEVMSAAVSRISPPHPGRRTDLVPNDGAKQVTR